MKRTLILAAFVVIAACKTKKETTTTTETKPAEPVASAIDCATKGMTFSEIKPILEEHCTRCHGDMNGYSEAKETAASGYLLGVIKHKMGYKPMPKEAPQIPQAQIDMIECWVNNGMKN